MDYELLVEERFDQGKEFIAKLFDRGFDLAVAFWARTSEAGRWYLFVGSNILHGMDLGDAYRALYAEMSKIPETIIEISNTKILDPADSIARSAIAIRDRYSARVATKYHGDHLGRLAIEEAYIYPRIGPMTQAEIINTVTALSNRAGLSSPSIVTLRDGTHIQVVPLGTHTFKPGLVVHALFHDLIAGVDRSIPVDDVVGIM